MTLTIDLDSDLDQRLRAEAMRRGLSRDDLARRLIEGGLPPGPAAALPPRKPLTPEEWSREFEALGKSVDPSVPLLSDEAVSRESFYEERE
ncbi:MAG: hypothetical protein HY321_04135 [Armatimonadetes bacterium]|nr:hypothetical protein [Armatimonadota bacterium]